MKTCSLGAVTKGVQKFEDGGHRLKSGWSGGTYRGNHRRRLHHLRNSPGAVNRLFSRLIFNRSCQGGVSRDRSGICRG